ncbi:MAG: cytochrome c3 family protein [Halioglobus sp.]
MATKNTPWWILWLLLTVALAAYLVSILFDDEADKTMFMPGQTSSGHYQIELACNACHTGPYADQDGIQEACEGCHADSLRAAKDDHPKSKFTDPRNAERIAVLDARYCVSCHVEHRPEITHEMGVTMPEDVCYLCHESIAEDRPSHSGMEFDTCASAGCHNFHDNRALYEDFLLKHMDAANTDFAEQLLTSNLRDIAEQLPDYPLDEHPLKATNFEQQNLPEGIVVDQHLIQDWLGSGHASAGVGCDACHVHKIDDEKTWIDKPDHSACSSCHKGEVKGFLSGKHGMRLNLENLGYTLSPMTPGLARLPMREEAANEELSCQSCHGAHRYEIAEASAESCLGCHADDHSLAYRNSKHFELLQSEMADNLPAGSGVSCASCHMPRIEKDYYWGTFIHHEVQHNQSENLAPNEKMIRPVCLQCHGLPFVIDALADPALTQNNFSEPPTVHVESIDLARQRLDDSSRTSKPK